MSKTATANESFAPAVSTVADTFLAKLRFPCVYCGPSVKGIAKQYTVYTSAVPDALRQFIQEHPIVRGLIIPTARFAEVRAKLDISNSAEAILFQKLKSQL